MNPTYLTAVATSAVGALLLLGWAYLTTDNPRSNRLLGKSLWLFVLPGVAIWALPDWIVMFPLSMWVLVLVEECLKAFGARTERSSLDKFSLVALFGIWELMIAKPVWALTGGEIPPEWGRAEVTAVVLAATAPFLMHLVTAAIYGFHFKDRWWAALLASWLLHTVFNESADLMGVSPLATGAKLFLLTILLIALWPEATPSETTASAGPSN